MMIELWGRKNAYNVQKVVWTLTELDLEYVHHDVGSNPGELETTEYRAINPHARIPTLVDQGEVIWESNSIIRYLAASHDSGGLWAEQPLQRSCAERWMDWELAKLQPDFIDLFWGFYRTPENQRDMNAINESKKRCSAHFQLLDQHLQQHQYLAGDSFSMGDIPIATCLYRYFSMGLEVEQPEHVMNWYQRLAERGPFKRSIMVRYEELKGRVEY